MSLDTLDSRYMSEVRFIDPTFGVEPPARALLAILEGMTLDLTEVGLPEEASEVPLIDFDTQPWYNGRERAYQLVVAFHGQPKKLAIVFGEDRHSDDLFVDAWEVPFLAGRNGLTVADYTDEAYSARKCFPDKDYLPAADYIKQQVMDWLRKTVKAITRPKKPSR